MASQSRSGGASLPDRPSKNQATGIVTKLSRSPIVSKGKEVAGDAALISKKLLKSTSKAAWTAGTNFLILVVPLIIEMDREQQLKELELQQASFLVPLASTMGPPPLK